MTKSSSANRNRTGQNLRDESHKAAVVSSALWAAAGDALGWITELGDEETVTYRTGSRRVEETVEWKRRIGGRFGPTVRLAAGTYSDDTQLRLSVSRATRGTGEFDVTAFAKVELPVWLSYSLGAGRGTSAAAANLAKPSVTWFSNFFSSRDGRGYFAAGGNGAAMRIQPHVWKSKTLRFEDFAADVLRDSITTHGHPIGFCGAIFHAVSVAYALKTQEIPSPNEWKGFVELFRRLPAIAKADEQLGLFWIRPWEEQFGTTLQTAVDFEADRALSLIADAQSVLKSGRDSFRMFVKLVGGFEEQTRGSGTNTAIAAVALSSLGRDLSAEETISLGANTIGSDTDTIASMAGAILGAVRGGEPKWRLQDRSYLISEAIRMADIAAGKDVASFPYPDLMTWSPPTTQGDAVGVREKSLWVAGLGKAEAIGEIWSNSEADWQWLRLDLGQTVLAKRRSSPRELSELDLPTELGSPRKSSQRAEEPSLFPRQQFRPGSNKARPENQTQRSPLEQSKSVGHSLKSIDELTDWIIEENFDPQIIGKAFLLAAQGANATDRSIALAAVVAKAVEARRRRANR